MDDGPLGPLRLGPHPRAPSSFCLRVALVGSDPAVWRRLRVSARMTLRRLHNVLRCVLGWPDIEAHRFRVGEVLYGTTSEGRTTRDSRWTMLGEIVRPGVGAFYYELAGPAAAIHEVRVETALEEETPDSRTVCLGGEGVVPGGKSTEDRVEFMAPDGLDHAAFDLESVNAALARLR